ncbi:MAG: glycosyltransferase [Verrucomicrobiota bacterium]
MAASVPDRLRVRVDGKFFRLGEKKMSLKGVTYGPFAPHQREEPFASPEQTERDFDQIRRLGANLLRVYCMPPRWFLDLAAQYDLKLLVDVPWNKHVCFLDAEETRLRACAVVRQAAEACAAHPAVCALSVVNEISPDIVRWSGAGAVADFIDELAGIVKAIEPACLCTFGNYPPTEFLRPQSIDFHCFNVYLHEPRPFANYLARLQMIADGKPLILGEFGIDSLRESEERKSQILAWTIETTFRSGLAGAVVYSFTDDWFKDGQQVTDWAFGLTTRERQPKASFAVVEALFRSAPFFPLPQTPLVSVVVACYNGERTLPACLDSLQHLNYPAYEVILVDDGSTDATAEIAARYPDFHTLRHPANLGLSTARNTGIEAARGDIVAFTDADCRADEDWLYYLVGDLLNSQFAAMGGHNLLPADDSSVAAAIMVSPGGPAHVMLTDRLAEHVPGCNMAFYKWALHEIGGFDPLFRKAGDDVDVCWRLQQRGLRVGFSPAGFVWHYRRSTIRDYLKQQEGYGEAEALLVHRHPEYFNWFGGSQWQGRIYSAAKFGLITRSPMIYHGLFGSALFQTLYTPQPAFTLMLLTSLEYYVFIAMPLLILGGMFDILVPLAITGLLVPLAVCGAAAVQAELPKAKKKLWSRPLVALLFFLQPIVRGWARYQGRLRVPRTPLAGYESLDSLSRDRQGQRYDVLQYWNPRGLDRLDFLRVIMERLDQKGWQNKADAGWNHCDVEIYGSRWSHLQLTTVTEVLGPGQQLIRCRLRPAWTLLAKVTFWAGLGLELLIISALVQTLWWLSFLLLSLGALVWFLAKEERDLQRLIAVFLDDVAGDLRFEKVNPEPPSAG